MTKQLADINHVSIAADIIRDIHDHQIRTDADLDNAIAQVFEPYSESLPHGLVLVAGFLGLYLSKFDRALSEAEYERQRAEEIADRAAQKQRY